MVEPLIILPDSNYVGLENNLTQEVCNDYFSERIRGSEVVPCDVQQFRDPYGQQP